MKTPPTFQAPELYTPAEVAAMFKVKTVQVTRWANAGKFTTVVKTLGGHRRYDAVEVRALREQGESR